MTNKAPRLFPSFRFLVGVFAFLGLGIIYMQRVNMGLAVLCMTNHTALSSINSNQNINVSYEPDISNDSFTNSTQKCFLKTNKQILIDGPFIWTKPQQGFILSAFFYGYFAFQIPGGWLALKLGGKNVFGMSILLGSIMTMLLPFAAKQGYYFLIVCRLLTGAFQAPALPSFGAMYNNWVPPLERSRLTGLATSGIQIGNIVALPLGSYLCLNGFDGGWPSIFYIYGLLGIALSLVFMLSISNDPKSQKCMNKAEKLYVLNETKAKTSKPRKTPWLAILKSRVCIALNVGCFCFNSGFYMLVTQMPSYIKDVLKFDIKSNGILSSLPFMANFILLIFTSILADHLIKNKVLTLITVRRLFSAIGFLSPIISFICLSFVTCENPYIGIAILTTGHALTAFIGSGGMYVTAYEVAGPFTSILIGITNSVANISGFIVPTLIGLLTKNHTQEEWQRVFWIISVVYFIGFMTYMILVDVELQPWAKDEDEENEKNGLNSKDKDLKERLFNSKLDIMS